MHIENDRLLAPHVAHPTGNIRHGGRITATAICLHETASPVVFDHSGRFIRSGGGKYKASYHVISERESKDGIRIQQFVDFDRRANHAGPSLFKGRHHCNNFMPGLAFASPGLMPVKHASKTHARLKYGRKVVAEFPLVECERATSYTGVDGYWLPYTYSQLSDMFELCERLVETYPTITDITTHSRIDTRGWKSDAGPLLPLDEWRLKLFAGRKPQDDMLRIGAHDETSDGPVRAMQSRLVHYGYRVGDVDGYFGAETEGALLFFQKQNGLTPDGIVGPKTWKALRSEVAKHRPTATRENATDKDLRERGSRTIKAADTVEVGGLVAGGTALSQIVPVETLTKYADLVSAIQQPAQTLATFGTFMLDHWMFMIAILFAGLCIYAARKMRSFRVSDFINGSR